MEGNNEFKKIDMKISTCSYFNDIININNFDLDNISLDEKSCENFLNYDVAYKLHMVQSLYVLFLMN